MKRRGRQVYIENDLWELVEKAAEKDKRTVNKWIEIHLTAFFLKQKLNDSK